MVLLVCRVLDALGWGELFHEIPTVYSDASAARGICSRSGVGKLKHMQTRFLWVQESLRHKHFKLATIDSSMNTSDLGTKYLDASRRAVLLSMMPLLQVRNHNSKGLGQMVAALTLVAGTVLVAGHQYGHGEA